MPIPERMPQTVGEMFPSKWLHANDLMGRAWVVVIEDVNIEPIRQRDNSEQLKPVLTLRRGQKVAQKRLILNKTQSAEIAAIAGTERMNDWIGVEIQLVPGIAKNRKPTINIMAAPHRDGNGGA